MTALLLGSRLEHCPLAAWGALSQSWCSGSYGGDGNALKVR